MKAQTIKVEIVTDGSGDFVKELNNHNGLLYKIVYTIGGLAATADLTITNRHGTTVFAQSNITASFEKYPRVVQNLNTDGTALTTHDCPLVDGPLTVTLAQGGAAMRGTLELFLV